MNSELTYIDAVPSDSKLLTKTAFDSKQIWGYPDELMDLWKTDLEVNEEYILKNKVVKVFDANMFIGFFALKAGENGKMEIDHLWLIPGKIKKGYGKLIFRTILDHLRLAGHRKASLIAEPNAKGFYDKMGGKVIGQFQSKINGRVLDIYEFEVGN